MSIFSRSAAVISILLGAIFSWSSAVIAADWPHRTVRLILPVPAGAAADFTARLFAERLSQRWGQPVIVENRPGADGIVGVSAFLGTDDDHTLLYAISAVFTVHPITQQKLPYDPVRDLVPISPTSDVVLAIAASEKSSIRSLDDLVRTARAQPGKLNWAASPGLPPFIAGGFFKRSKLDLAFVSYRDIGPALQDLGEGRIDVFVHALGVIMSQVQSGRARLLAVASDVRVPIAPDVPIVTEAGFPSFEWMAWWDFTANVECPTHCAIGLHLMSAPSRAIPALVNDWLPLDRPPVRAPRPSSPVCWINTVDALPISRKP